MGWDTVLKYGDKEWECGYSYIWKATLYLLDTIVALNELLHKLCTSICGVWVRGRRFYGVLLYF